ncbi:MAG: phosphoribosylformylglycinamidine synthase subunit PurL, partial [archaeon]|nr:phosphoribosylformylglycinamidine synthase subunit PurL [archaeon]
GIPTITGGFFFDESYTGNCLVNVCCLGIVKRADLLNNFASAPGEIMILFGGRTGRDGIHGVNFASKDITATSEDDSRGAVQLGDPITKEPVIHACLELAQKHLVTGMKDLGGGGLSCVVGEMAIEKGFGADVDLDKVPLKETGLAPWEIWVSESQERMMCTVKPENVDKVMAIFDLWDIIATPVAKTTDTGHTRLFWGGEQIFDMDIEFLTGGPVYNRPYTMPKVSTKADEKFPKLPALSEVVLTLLSDPNVASKEWAIRQYDHEVRAGTVLHPMVGKLNKTGPGDASVLMPVPGRWKGLAAAVGCNPWFTAADPYKGGMASIDEAYRNVVAVGAMPNAFTDCLNFGNPEKPERLGEFREAVHGIGDIARELGIPIPSGNVSLYNEAPEGNILPTPMIVCCGLIDDVRKAVSADMKKVGSCLFVIGKTADEMGGSLLFRKFNGTGGDVPATDVKRLKENSARLLKAMDEELVLSCHDCSDGGLAIAVAEMCISGQIGAELDLSAMEGDDVNVKLFAESTSRWIAEVDGKDVTKFTEIMGDAATLIGITKGDSLVVKGTDLSVPVEELRAAWNDPIWKIMGGGVQ